MIKQVLFTLFFLCLSINIYADVSGTKKIKYKLTDELIDVVIVTHPKDKETLDLCIEGIRENCDNIGRVIVVSSSPLTDKAEWFDENDYPFSKADIALKLAKNDANAAKNFMEKGPVGWYFQQLLKLYAMFAIPGISSNVLVIDADTVFMNPVKFMNEKKGGLFCLSYKTAKQKYYQHAARMVPDYKTVYPEYYSVCHHMLFQRAILEDLFQVVENHHDMPFWEAFCWCVELPKDHSGRMKLVKCRASEYEIYYNYALTHTKQVQLRHLEWKNSPHLNLMNQYQKDGYHFVSFHTYMRK